jgi:hypothetical protein
MADRVGNAICSPGSQTPYILSPILFDMEPTKTFPVYTSKQLNINSISVSRAHSLYRDILSIRNAIIIPPYLQQAHSAVCFQPFD